MVHKKEYKFEIEDVNSKIERKLSEYNEVMNRTQGDIEFIQKGEKDLQNVNKNIKQIFLTQEQRKMIEVQDMKQTTFGKQKERIK